MDIDKIENDDFFEYIQKIVSEKAKLGDWEVGVNEKSKDLVSILLYEYSSSIEKLTEGKISAKQVVNKLSIQMGKLRFRDFKTGMDDDITYDGLSVTSDAYKRKCRIENHFGAHALTYMDKRGKNKSAIVLFDDKQENFIDGTKQKLSGINLEDLSDIRETIFHEWTHVMERCAVKASQLNKEDIVHKEGSSVYINSMLSPELSKNELEDYVDNIDELLKSDTEIPFGGISTIELNDMKNSNQRIMHNQISEGATEFIARKVMETIGDEVKHPNRYSEQVKIISKIFEGKGLSDSITMYLTEPYKLIKTLENTKVQEKDMLHYISDYINSSHLSRLFNRCKIDKEGNVQIGAIQKIIDRVKKLFPKKDSAMLPQGEQNFREEKIIKKEFLESIRVSPEDLIKNIRYKKNVKSIEDKDGPNLDI